LISSNNHNINNLQFSTVNQSVTANLAFYPKNWPLWFKNDRFFIEILRFFNALAVPAPKGRFA
ncbi:MAG: hypothetical protein ABR907_17555, partial [Terracidiphilus sp.]